MITIKVYNKKKEYVETIISDEDYDKISKLKLYFSGKDNNIYVFCNFDKKKTPIHQIIIGKSHDENMIIDHIDKNKLNNTRENLRVVSRSINSHNINKKENSTSKYIGVSYSKERNKWISRIRISGKLYNLGSFNKEIEAAKMYDKIVYQVYKMDGNTNNLLTKEEINDAVKTSFSKIIKIPTYITKLKNGSYRVGNKDKYFYVKTIDEANLKLQEFLKFKKEKDDENYNKSMSIPILRDNDNNPIIVLRYHYNISLVYIDEDIWYKLNNIKWHVNSNGYAQSKINNKIVKMHRYIYKLYNTEIESIKSYIDHINNNRLDNRICNLRIVSASINNQNKESLVNSSSQYLGVLKTKSNKWSVCIKKNGNRNYLGVFNNENEAAEAYNKKALELYGENAKINKLNVENILISDIKKTSKYLGVTKTQNKWVSRINKDGKCFNLGRFNSENEAAEAYNKKALELFGEKAKINKFK